MGIHIEQQPMLEGYNRYASPMSRLYPDQITPPDSPPKENGFEDKQPVRYMRQSSPENHAQGVSRRIFEKYDLQSEARSSLSRTIRDSSKSKGRKDRSINIVRTSKAELKCGTTKLVGERYEREISYRLSGAIRDVLCLGPGEGQKMVETVISKGFGNPRHLTFNLDAFCATVGEKRARSRLEKEVEIFIDGLGKKNPKLNQFTLDTIRLVFQFHIVGAAIKEGALNESFSPAQMGQRAMLGQLSPQEQKEQAEAQRRINFRAQKALKEKLKETNYILDSAVEQGHIKPMERGYFMVTPNGDVIVDNQNIAGQFVTVVKALELRTDLRKRKGLVAYDSTIEMIGKHDIHLFYHLFDQHNRPIIDQRTGLHATAEMPRSEFKPFS